MRLERGSEVLDAAALGPHARQQEERPRHPLTQGAGQPGLGAGFAAAGSGRPPGFDGAVKPGEWMVDGPADGPGDGDGQQAMEGNAAACESGAIAGSAGGVARPGPELRRNRVESEN